MFPSFSFPARVRFPRLFVSVTLALVASQGVGCGDDAASSGSTPDPKLVAVEGVHIDAVAIYQGVKVPLMEAGAPAGSPLPVIEGRNALLRVYVSTDDTYDLADVVVRVSLVADDDAPLELETVLPALSNDDDLDSTVNFDIPGDRVVSGLAYRIEVGRLAQTGDAPTAYPAAGNEAVLTENIGSTLKIVLVPVQYDADGSGRLPDTSDEQVALYRDGFSAMYPAPTIDLTVHAPLPSSQAISANGAGWGEILDRIQTLRQQDKVADDVYYFGIFNPKGSFGSYCNQGCVTGLASLAGPNDPWARSGVGVGFSGPDAVETALHEIGHTHGRQHAPCDVGDPDKSYPYPQGRVGVQGWDGAHRALIPPTFADIMGYCSPEWISDYTFFAIADRMKIVNGARIFTPESQRDRLYDRVRVGLDGSVEWLDSVRLPRPPSADATSVALDTPNGKTTIAGQFYRYDHLSGGVLLWPHQDATLTRVRFEADGKVFDVAARQ